MKLSIKFFLIGILLLGQQVPAQGLSDESIPLIIVKEVDDGVNFEKIFIEKNQLKIISDPSVITIVLPLSEGKSGSLVKESDRSGKIIIKNTGEQLDIKFLSNEGKEKSYPSVLYETLKTFQTRVNITKGGGYKQAFVIDNYNSIKKDDGPVLDILGGIIPLDPDDYSITLETKIVIASQLLTGNIPFMKIGGWLVVEATLPGRTTGKFIVDTGASGGLVVTKDVLPKDIEISEVKAIMYSDKGKSESKGKMQGATGSVKDDTFLGVANLRSYKIGDINLENIKTNVLKQLPEYLENLNIIGIIGIDILKNAEIIRIENINDSNGTIKFMSKENKVSGSYDHSFSFTSAGNLLFTNGSFGGGTPLDFLIDLGARNSIISRALIADNKIQYTNVGNSNSVGGLSGDKTDVFEGKFNGVKIGNNLFNEINFLISSDLYITKTIGLEKSGAILGMNFYSQFKTMEIDFIESKIYLIN